MDIDDLVKEFEQQVEWFCDRLMEPLPFHPEDKKRIYQKMINTGWIRQSEVDTYEQLVNPKDDD